LSDRRVHLQNPWWQEKDHRAVDPQLSAVDETNKSISVVFANITLSKPTSIGFSEAE
jgi:hypothetical protein